MYVGIFHFIFLFIFLFQTGNGDKFAHILYDSTVAIATKPTFSFVPDIELLSYYFREIAYRCTMPSLGVLGLCLLDSPCDFSRLSLRVCLSERRKLHSHLRMVSLRFVLSCGSKEALWFANAIRSRMSLDAASLTAFAPVTNFEVHYHVTVVLAVVITFSFCFFVDPAEDPPDINVGRSQKICSPCFFPILP